jgi:protein involved in polysaccharide export with SLBB domain
VFFYDKKLILLYFYFQPYFLNSQIFNLYCGFKNPIALSFLNFKNKIFSQMNIKTYLIFLLSFLSLLTSAQISSYQNTNPQMVNVGDISDDEVIRLIKEMEKRGISEAEAIMLGRARGMSEVQISELKRRIDEIKSNSAQIDASEGNIPSEQQLIFENSFSQKEELEESERENRKRIFGYSFFNNKKLTFQPGNNASISPSYLLGVGDEILIDVWGASEQSYKLLVDRNGNINIPNVGLVNIGGKTLKNVIEIIKNKLILIYSDLSSDMPRTFASVNIGQIRPIKVNVIGEVFSPGTYTISGASTAFNALYLSGGPNEKGSYRNIHVIRDGKKIANVDVYKYLIDGYSKENIHLRDGDIVLVQPYINKVILEGEFKRTGIFEAKEKETITDILRFCGGFTENAYTHRLELYRKTTRDLEFKDVLNSEFDNISLSNGDSIYVGKIINRMQNMVTITGAIYRPGNYELTDSLTLSELLNKADGLREDAFIYRGIITRLNDDLSLQSIAFNLSKIINKEEDVLLKREDVITISSIHDLKELHTVQIYGKVQNPGLYDFKEGMTLEDIIFEAGGFLNAASDAYIEVARRLSVIEEASMGEKIVHVFQKKVPRNLELSPNDKAFELQPFDKVFIRQLPGHAQQAVIKITGEVAYSGEYALSSKKERISDLIKRAGGLTPDAYPSGAMLTRKKEISKKMERLREELMARDTTLSFSDLDFEVVGVNLNEIIKKPGGKDDVFLKDGDEINIPREFQTINISGEVLNPISATYHKGKRLKAYVSESGGFGMLARKRKVYVVYPNGTAADTKNFLFFKKYPKIQPGSEIVVPARPDREPLPTQAYIAMSSALASLTLTILTIADRLN